jgi:DNA invertase Pin-like site-specific DNA recombinase
MPELKSAAVYIRVSTEDQAELSPESQLSAIRLWAEKNGYLLPERFIFLDEGISGRSAAKRPRFNAMIALAKSRDHPFDAILVWKFSRFARNQEESIVYKAMLQRAGVNVISISEPIIDGPFGSLIERIIEWMDEYYSIRLAGEVKRSMTRNAEKGVRQAAPPFGYRKGPPEGPGMVPQEEEAAIIRMVFREFNAGTPVQQITDRLNAAGIRTHRGGVIERRTVTYWLQNPVYIGLNRWTPTGRTRRDFSNPDTLLVPGDHAPLVSRKAFEEAGKRIALERERHRPKARPGSELKDWMSGVVRCADCGKTLVFQRPCYMVCNGYIHRSCTVRQTIRIDELHEAVLERLRADTAAASAPGFAVLPSDGAEEELRPLRRRAEQLAKKLARLREAYASGMDSLEEYRGMKQETEAQRAAVLDRISELESKADPPEAEKRLRERIVETLRVLETPEDSPERKNAAIKAVLENCTWHKASRTLTVSYRVRL